MFCDIANVSIESTRNLITAVACATESITKLSSALQSLIDRANQRESRTQSLIKSTDRRQRARGYRRALAPVFDLCNAAKMWQGPRDAI